MNRSNADTKQTLKNPLRNYAWLCVGALLLAGPLLFLPPDAWLHNAQDTPRRLLLGLGGGVLLALLLFAWARERRIVWRAHPLDIPLAACVAGVLISGAFSAFPAVSFLAPHWSQR